MTRLFEKEYGLPVNSNPTDPRSRVRTFRMAPCVLRSSLHVSTDCTPRTGALVERLRSTCSECLGDLTTVRQCLGHTVSRLSEGYSNKSRVTEGSGASQVTRLRRAS